MGYIRRHSPQTQDNTHLRTACPFPIFSWLALFILYVDLGITSLESSVLTFSFKLVLLSYSLSRLWFVPYILIFELCIDVAYVFIHFFFFLPVSVTKLVSIMREGVCLTRDWIPCVSHIVGHITVTQ